MFLKLECHKNWKARLEQTEQAKQTEHTDMAKLTEFIDFA